MRALVFSLDDEFVIPFEVLWNSLMKTESVPADIPTFILHEASLNESSIEEIKTFVGRYGRSLEFLDTTHSMPNNLPLKKSDHVSKATFYRLFLASVMPKECTSVVYIDSDTIVIRSIRSLFEVELVHPIAAVDHVSPKESLRLWGPCVEPYFQAGVLVIDIQKWRDERQEKLFKYVLAHRQSEIRWWDQDVLNIAFRDRWQRLPIWFNCCRFVRRSIPDDKLINRVCLIHFDGPHKPWNKRLENFWGVCWYKAYQEAIGAEFDRAAIGGYSWQDWGGKMKLILKDSILGSLLIRGRNVVERKK